MDDAGQFRTAAKGKKTAQSQVDAAEAQLRAAQDLVGFTELKADRPAFTRQSAPAAGEVVQAGQMIVRLRGRTVATRFSTCRPS